MAALVLFGGGGDVFIATRLTAGTAANGSLPAATAAR